jgi:glycosyltransferase involved in cell wall biosynthesis
MVRSNEELRISVVIPCYNAEKYIAAALDSILMQEHAADEIIVVNDGSTDASGSIVMGQFGAHVRYEPLPHVGLSAALNHGLRMVRGNCLAFLDADDLWPSDSLGSRFVALAANSAIDCVYGQLEQFLSPELGPTARTAVRFEPGVHSTRVRGTMLMRKRVLDEIGDFDSTLRLGEAIDFVARMDEAGLISATIDKLVLRRRIHDTNMGIREKAHRSDYLRLLKASLDRRRQAAEAQVELV